jgi:hypothetical protein
MSSRLFLRRLLREAAAAKRPIAKTSEKTFAEGFKIGWESIAGANTPAPSGGVLTQNYRGETAYLEGIRMGMEAANDLRPLKLKLGSNPRRVDS